MRVFILVLTLLGVPMLAACTTGSGSNSAAIKAMDNPPNSCGPGGSQDIVDCANGA